MWFLSVSLTLVYPKKNSQFQIMKFAIFLSMVQTISCNAILDAELAMAIEELQSQKIDMQEIRKELDKVFQSECDTFNSEI